MNLPNALTLLRIFFVPLLVALLVQRDLPTSIGPWYANNEFLALAVFLAAAATDLLDGYLARRWRQVTTVGTLLDPIADKLLVSAAMIALVEAHRVPAWMIVLIVGREFAVSGLRSIAAAEGYTIQASDLGKVKMVAQVIAISLLLLSGHWPGLAWWGLLWLWCVVLSSLLSAGSYFLNFWRKVDASIKQRRRRELLQADRQTRQSERAARRRKREITHSSPDRA